jgi:hypothetical protein
VTLNYNQPPDAVNDSASTSQGQSVTIPVLVNDSDPENDPFSITGTTPPANGSIVVNADGTITYTPNSGFSGQDTFTYTISDGSGGTDTATVTVNVAPNAPPVIDLDANDSSGATGANYFTSFAGTGIPIADLDSTITDVDSVQMSQAVITLTNPQAGRQPVDPRHAAGGNYRDDLAGREPGDSVRLGEHRRLPSGDRIDRVRQFAAAAQPGQPQRHRAGVRQLGRDQQRRDHHHHAADRLAVRHRVQRLGRRQRQSGHGRGGHERA